MQQDWTRREFLKRSAAFAAGAAVSTGLPLRALAGVREPYKPAIDLAVASGASPVKNTLAAVEKLGGFGKFVRPGDKVALKPNPIGASPPEQAINTHPEMIGAVVKGCLGAGAARVIVLSHDSPDWFEGNGTAEAVRRAGGIVKPINDRADYVEIPLPRARLLHSVEIARDIAEADVFINMPIAKHHAGARVTFAMKNLMGANWDRIILHRLDLQATIAELATAVRHDLIIMDANHALLTNGPSGPGRVSRPQTVIAGVDPVAVDAWACRYLDVRPESVGHIRHAWELGVGEMNLDRLKIDEFAA